MLTFALSAIAAELPGQRRRRRLLRRCPGEDAANNGLTLWLPNALYIPKTTEGAKLEAAKKFLAFVATPDGCDAADRRR